MKEKEEEQEDDEEKKSTRNWNYSVVHIPMHKINETLKVNSKGKRMGKKQLPDEMKIFACANIYLIDWAVGQVYKSARTLTLLKVNWFFTFTSTSLESLQSKRTSNEKIKSTFAIITSHWLQIFCWSTRKMLLLHLLNENCNNSGSWLILFFFLISSLWEIFLHWVFNEETFPCKSK